MPTSPTTIPSKKELFSAFTRLVNEVYAATPEDRSISEAELERAGTRLAEEFTRLLDEYLKSSEARRKVFSYMRENRYANLQ